MTYNIWYTDSNTNKSYNVRVNAKSQRHAAMVARTTLGKTTRIKAILQVSK